MEERWNNIPCGYVSITTQGLIVDVNQTFLDMGNYTRSNLVSNHIETIMSIANKLIFHTYFYPFIQLNGHVDEMYISIKGSNGKDIPVLLNGKYYNEDGMEFIDCVFVHLGKRIDYEQEIRLAKQQIEEAYREKNDALAKMERLHLELEQKQEELIKLNTLLAVLSTTDGLTGLNNRRFFMEKLKGFYLTYQQTNIPFSLLIMDIDHFKLVNDTWGHPIGDQVLIKLAQILTEFFQKEDVVARYGGEEFVIIIPVEGEEESIKVAERLRVAIQTADWEIGEITVSIGVTTSNPNDTDLSILAKADKALYVSKANGRNRVTHTKYLSYTE